MSNSSSNLPPTPEGTRPENRDWVEITIRPPLPAVNSVPAQTQAVLPAPSNPLAVATDNLNVTSHQIPPTGGRSSEENQKNKRKKTSGSRKKTNGTKDSDSRTASIKCNNCGRIGHKKRHCKFGTKPGSGGTRGSKKKDLIEESLRDTAAQAAGAQDAAEEAAADESVQPSSDAPEQKAPEHYSSLHSSLTDHEHEKFELQRITGRIFDGPHKDSSMDAFFFWMWRFGLFYLLTILLEIIIAGWWALIVVFTQLPLALLLVEALRRNCIEKKWWYDRYILANQIYANRINVNHMLLSQYDTDPIYSTEVRVDTHSLKKEELKPYLYHMSIYRANDKHWMFNAIAPAFFRLPPKPIIVSGTLLKHMICDVDFFNDPKQLLIKSQMQALRNQRVAIAASDIATYGDIYGDTALIAALHNEQRNLQKRRILDFPRSPAGT